MGTMPQKKAKTKKERGQDFYQTPECCTQLFLNTVDIPKSKSILEPCCGQKAIVNVLLKNGYNNLKYYDLYQEGDWEQKDFLKEEEDKKDIIISNPPYLESMAFVLKAMEVAKDVYFFLPLNYLHGKKRYTEIFSQRYLKNIFIMTRYIYMSKEYLVSMPKSGQMAMAWYHFSQQNEGQATQAHWIDCDAL